MYWSNSTTASRSDCWRLQHTGLAGKGPGEYKLRGKTSVLEMITVAGGPTADADLKSVRMQRRNGETVSLNLYKTIIQGDLSQDWC